MGSRFKEEIVATYEKEEVAKMDAAIIRKDGYDADYKPIEVDGITKYQVFYMKYMGNDDL
jgi:hypothetical protein